MDDRICFFWGVSHPPTTPAARDSAMTPAPRTCANCGAVLEGPYCSQCGQHDVDYVRSFHHLAEDVLENLFHFEGKFPVTVAWLLAQPGRLTKDFVAGRRQSQLNPLRFYIFATVLFFLGVHLLNHGHLLNYDRAAADRLSQTMSVETDKIATAHKLTADQKAELARRIEEVLEKNGPQAKLDLNRLASEIQSGTPEGRNGTKPATSENTIVVALPGGLTHSFSAELGRRLKEKLGSGVVTVSEFTDDIEHRVPTILFMGMPIFALILKLLYVKSGRYYIEHLVFSLHLHTWVFIALMVGDGYLKLAGLGPEILPTLLEWVLLGWGLWYLVTAFRTVYGGSWLRTCGATVAAAGLYAIALAGIALAVMFAIVVWIAFE